MNNAVAISDLPMPHPAQDPILPKEDADPILEQENGPKIVQIHSSDCHDISQSVGKIIEEKQRLIDATLNNSKKRYHPLKGSDTILITSNVFNAGYLFFEGIKCAAPGAEKIPEIALATTWFGILGGAIDVAVGVICLKEAKEAFASGDNAKGWRLAFEGALYIALGSLICLSSLSAYIGVFGGITAFLAANPWIMPMLWAIHSAPLILEILRTLAKHWEEKDIASNLKLDELQEKLSCKSVDFETIENHFKGTILDFDEIRKKQEQEQLEALSQRVEKIQMELGPESAVTAMKLAKAILDKKKDDAKLQIKELQGRVEDWKKIYSIRLGLQMIHVADFALCMIGMHLPADTQIMEAAQDFALSLSYAAGDLPINISKPFARNTPLIVPKVDVSKLVKAEQTSEINPQSAVS